MSTRKAGTGGKMLAEEARNWNTPSTRDHVTEGPAVTARVRAGAMKTCDQRLRNQAANWQTPKARGDDYSPNAKRSNGGGHGLGAQSRNWPTPVANDDNKSVEAHLAMKARMKGGKRKAITSLNVFTKNWPTPNAHLAPRGKNFTKSDSHYEPHDLVTAIRSFRPARTTSKPGKNSSEPIRTLNPLFVESLMGLAPGMTGLEPVATESFHWWLRMHSERLDMLLQRKELRRAA